jgi:hypothetical protein
MLTSNPPYALWSIWKYLPMMPRLFFLILCVVGVYSLFFAGVTMAGLRAATSIRPKESSASTQRAVAALHRRCANVRQLIGATFYLFGFVLFLGLQWAYLTLDESKTPGGWLVLENFAVYFAFACNVFLVFLILHLVQWFVSGRVNACSLQLGTHNVA